MRYVLTEPQKREIRERYLNNVNRLNQYLPEKEKIRPNLGDLYRRLNDPNLQRRYLKGLELAGDRAKRLQLFQQLNEKYESFKKPGYNYLMNRTFQYLLDLRTTPEAEKYNEALIKTYFLHPEAVAQYAYQKAMELNPGDLLKIAKSTDSESLVIEYYERNRLACDFAYVINDAHNRFTDLTPEAKEHLDFIKYNYQLLYNAGGFINNITEGFYDMPILTENQKQLLLDSDLYLDDKVFAQKVTNNFEILEKEKQEELKKFATNCEKIKLDIDKPGAFSNYIAQDKATKEYYPIVDKLSEHIEADVDIKKLDEATSKKIRNIYAKDYIAEENVKFPKPVPNDQMKEYMQEFRYRYALNNNKVLYKLEDKSISDIISGIRRGVFEAIFRSTSDYTHRLKETIREFENTKPATAKSKQKLRDAAQAYLDHKGVHNRAEALRKSSAAKNRSLLCLDLIAAVDATKEKAEFKIDNELVNDNNIIKEDENKGRNLLVDPEELLNEYKNLEKDNKVQVNNEDFQEKIKESVNKEEKVENVVNEEINEIEINTDLVK